MANISRVNDYSFNRWNIHFSFCFTTLIPVRLYSRFRHPHADRHANLLKCAVLDKVLPAVRHIIARLDFNWVPSETKVQKSGLIQFKLGDVEDFNNYDPCRHFPIDGKRIAHVVLETASFRLLSCWKLFTLKIWLVLERCFVDVYIDPLNLIFYIAGMSYLKKSFALNTDLLHIAKKLHRAWECELHESDRTIPCCGEKWFHIIEKENLDDVHVSALQMAIERINDSMRPDRVGTKLLIVEELLRLEIPTDKPIPSTYQYAIAQRKETEAMTKQYVDRQVKNSSWARMARMVQKDTMHLMVFPFLLSCQKTLDTFPHFGRQWWWGRQITSNYIRTYQLSFWNCEIVYRWWS